MSDTAKANERLDAAPSWAEFVVEIRRDVLTQERRLEKDFEFRSQQPEREVQAAMSAAASYANTPHWETLKITIRRLDDPLAQDTLPNLSEALDILLLNETSPSTGANEVKP